MKRFVDEVLKHFFVKLSGFKIELTCGRIFCSVLLCCVCNFLFAVENEGMIEKLNYIVGEEAGAELVKTSSLVHMSYDGSEEGVAFKFNSKLLSRMQEVLTTKKPIFTMETVSLVKKKQSTDQKKLSDILCSISSLKGLQYYSPSRKKMRLLYKDSYAVEKKEVKGKTKYVKVPDPIASLSDEFSILVFQEDLTFGKNIYEFKYFSDESGVALLVSNTEALYYSIFKALEAKDLNSMLIAYDLGEYVLLYTATQAKFRKIIGLENKVKNSFMARLEALSKWFVAMCNT